MKQTLIDEARKRISDDDPSHDFSHALRVLANAEFIASHEGGDLEIIVPAALFHDLVNYPKNDPRSAFSADESADAAREILLQLDYPESKIPFVMQAIAEHSFSKGIKPKSKESMIVQDADRLEYTGAIAVMRTFCSGGQMGRRLYGSEDTFCANRVPDCSRYSVDLFYAKLLHACKTMNTVCARKMAEKRTQFLHVFLDQLKNELFSTGPLVVDA